MTPKAIEEKYGLTPTQYPDFAALRGDPSDNLPSLPGVGEKTATKWIVEYGSLDQLLNNVENISGKVGDSLRNGIDAVKMNRHLTQLRIDCPIDEGVLDLEWHGINKKHLQKFYQSYEIRALATRITQLVANPAEPDPESASEDEWESFVNPDLDGVSDKKDKAQNKKEPVHKEWESEIIVKKLKPGEWRKLSPTDNNFLSLDIHNEEDQIYNVAISNDGETVYLITKEDAIEILKDFRCS